MLKPALQNVTHFSVCDIMNESAIIYKCDKMFLFPITAICNYVRVALLCLTLPFFVITTILQTINWKISNLL